MAGWFRIRSSEFSVGQLPEVGFIGIVVVGLQITEHWWHRIGAIVSDRYRLRVWQLREGFHVKAKVRVGVVAFRGRDIRFMRECFSGEQTDSGVLAALGEVVADLELVLTAAELAGRSCRKVI